MNYFDKLKAVAINGKMCKKKTYRELTLRLRILLRGLGMGAPMAPCKCIFSSSSILTNRTYFSPALKVNVFLNFWTHKINRLWITKESTISAVSVSDRKPMTDYLWVNVHDSRKPGNPQKNMLLNSCPDMINGVKATDNNQPAVFLCTCVSHDMKNNFWHSLDKVPMLKCYSTVCVAFIHITYSIIV